MKTFGTSKEFLISSEIEWENVGDGVQRQIMGYDDKIMMVNVKFEKGSIGPMHQHYHSQVTYISSGQFEMTIGDETRILNAGDSFYIPSNVAHGLVCLEAGLLIDVFSPIREDFMS
tara:strand:- start:4799 stop:5146 length:348 start_codon:yes stop_codon:yes gene_type:complete